MPHINSSGQPCDICGSKSNSELIVTCSNCQKSHEHIYCMRANICSVPESWYCEACRCPNPLSTREKQVQDSFVRGTGKELVSEPHVSKMLRPPFGKRSTRVLSRKFVPKKVETGKVKFLSLEDIYRIPFGAKPKPSPLKNSLSSQMGFFDTNYRPTPKSTSVAVAAPISSPEEDHSYRSPGHNKPLRVAKVQTTSPKQAVVCGQDKYEFDNRLSALDRHSGKAESLPSKDYTHKEDPVNVVLRCMEDRTSKQKTYFKFGEEDLPNPPAVEASWKGSFEVVDSSHKIYDGFQAYPPEKVLSKAYLVSKAMPRILQFTLQPRQYVWEEVFHTDSPSGFDIALYFWADDFYRSKYYQLLELMEKQDLSIKSRLEGVELLIFTSRQLPAESQRMNNQFYLWGVFLSRKGCNSSVVLKGKEHAVSFMLPNYRIGEYSASAPHEVDDQEVDMEIDMVGGREVGIVDKFLRSNSRAACWDNSDIPSQDLFARAHSDQPIKSTAEKHLRHKTTEAFDGFDATLRSLRLANTPGFLARSFMNISPVALTVDPPPGFSKSITLKEMSPAGLKVEPPPGFSKSITLKEMSPAGLKVEPPSGFSKSITLMETSPAALKVGPPPGFSKSITLMEMSPAPLKVEPPPGFSKSITLMEMSPAALKVEPHHDFTKSATHLKMQPVAHSVDPPPGFSMSTALVNMQPVAHSMNPPPGFSKSITLVKTSPGAHKVDAPPGLSQAIKLEKSDFSSKGLGMYHEHASDVGKHIVGAQPTIGGLENVEENVEEDELACMLCREGYSSKPNDMLGIYCYSKRVNLDTGTSTGSRDEFVFTTVARFNIIHFQCHWKSKRSDAALQNRKTEWEGATLRNNGTPCNCIFPLKGPFVPMLQYVRFVDQYWDNLNVLGRADGSRLRLLTYDVSLMLAKFATGAVFIPGSESGGRESDSRFLPFMIQMARHLIDQGSSTERQSMAKAVSSYLTPTSTEFKSTTSPGLHRFCGTEETVPIMMVNSLLFESYDSWLIHRKAFLQRGIYHAYMEHKTGRSLLPLSSPPFSVKSESVNTSEIPAGSNLFSIIQPMLVYTGLIEQLQSFFKLSESTSVRAIKAEGSDDNTGLQSWEVIMKQKLANIKKMLGFSKQLLLWLEDMMSSMDLQEAFFIMGASSDVVSGGFISCEDFVQAAIQAGKM